MADFENLSGNDKELQEFLMIEKQKALVNAQVCSTYVIWLWFVNDNNSTILLLAPSTDTRVQWDLLGEMHR